MSDLVRYILDYLDTNLYRDVSIDELSSYFGYEKSYLMKKFKIETGISIKNYVNRIRIYKSIDMLFHDELLLKVALENGFHSLEYYSEMFTKVMGFNPSTFKKYRQGQLSKEELEIVKNSMIQCTLFYTQLHNLRKEKEENKILRLEIPKEKKYVA